MESDFFLKQHERLNKLIGLVGIDHPIIPLLQEIEEVGMEIAKCFDSDVRAKLLETLEEKLTKVRNDLKELGMI